VKNFGGVLRPDGVFTQRSSHLTGGLQLRREFFSGLGCGMFWAGALTHA